MYYAFLQGLCWAMMFGVGECYFSLFATHIEAPKFYFGLLAGVPSLLGPISQLFGADAVETTKNRKRLVIISVILQSLCYAPMAALPFVTDRNTSYTLLFSIMLIYFVGAHYCVPAWNSWISVIVPSGERSSYFARTSRAVAFISLITKLAVAGALYYASTLAEPARESTAVLVFAIAFASAGIARFGSYIFIQKMYEPKYEHSPEDTFTFWQFIRRARESNFVRFVLFVSLIHFGAHIAGPYFLPYAVYTLKWEQWQWVLLESVGAVASIATMLFWGSFSQRFGNKKTLQYTAFVVALIPMFWVVSTNFYYLVLVNVCSGVSWAGFNLAAFNYILEAVSPNKRARCVAYFNLLVGAGIFGGAMLGGWLNEVLPPTLTTGSWSLSVGSPFVYLLVLSAFVRMSMGLLLVGSFRELREVEPFALKDLVFYISEMREPTGLRFGAMANPPEPEEEASPQSDVADKTEEEVR
jgi:MFS family permease